MVVGEVEVGEWVVHFTKGRRVEWTGTEVDAARSRLAVNEYLVWAKLARLERRRLGQFYMLDYLVNLTDDEIYRKYGRQVVHGIVIEFYKSTNFICYCNHKDLQIE